MSKDYYEILGVSKNASQVEIKNAFRKAALKHHPDRGGEAARFKEINEAYQILSNPQKRSQYDQFGSGFNAGGFNTSGFGNQGFNYEDFDFGASGFNSGFGGLGDIFESMFAGAFATINAEIEISLVQAVLGDRIEFKTSSGDHLELNIPAGTKESTQFRFRGKGNSHRRGRGDLIITVHIKMPRRLSREQKELFEKLKQSGM